MARDIAAVTMQYEGVGTRVRHDAPRERRPERESRARRCPPALVPARAVSAMRSAQRAIALV